MSIEEALLRWLELRRAIHTARARSTTRDASALPSAPTRARELAIEADLEVEAEAWLRRTARDGEDPR